MNFTEQALGDDERAEVAQFDAYCREMLKLETDPKPPELIVKMIKDLGDNIRRERIPNAEDYSILMACLWANQICSEMSWEWVLLSDGKEDYYGIVSPKREYAVLPMNYMKDVLTDPERENTILLFYNMLKAGKFTQQEPKSYQLLE